MQTRAIVEDEEVLELAFFMGKSSSRYIKPSSPEKAIDSLTAIRDTGGIILGLYDEKGGLTGYVLANASNRYYSLASIYVREEMRGKRASPTLLETLKEQVAKVGGQRIISTTIHSQNVPSQRAFVRAGFKLEKRRKGYGAVLEINP